MKNIDALAQYHTGMHARVGEPVEHLAHGYAKELASPIFATAIGLLKYTIDSHAEEEIEYVTTSGFETSKANLAIGETIVPDDEYQEDLSVSDDDHDAIGIEHKFMNLVRKVKSYTKDFFEPTPDHEL